MDKLERAKALRGDPHTHYNCAQAVAMAWAGECGLGEEEMRRLSAHFGGGMRHGATCGAVTGALMVLGLLGGSEEEAKTLLGEFQDKNGFLDCARLLQAAADRGEERKSHCDRMVCDAVGLLEEILEK